MNIPTFRRTALVSHLVLVVACLGCAGESTQQGESPAQKTSPAVASGQAEGRKASAGQTAEAKKARLGKSVWLETQGNRRRVLVNATVCLREGGYGLECLLCRRLTKEHESILSTDADAKVIHAGLLAAGAQPGHPVQYREKPDGGYETLLPTGTPIKITLQYEDKGKLVRVPAQQWVRHARTKKDLDSGWVFAGSVLWDNPDDEKKDKVYAATADGAYVCISNVLTALLDLPINSPKGLEERAYEPHTERIPPLEAPVTVILEPLPKSP